MSETTENTLSAYKGPEFQQRLMWQLLVEPEFAEKIIPNLAIEYFDDPNQRRLFIIVLEYFKKYEKVPNLQNQSIHQAINEFKSPNNKIEEESLFAVIKRIEFWNERVINKQMHYDGDVVQKSTNEFVKQQEYRKLAESILDKVKNGEIRSKYVITAIEDKFQKITHIGEEEDDCESVTEGIGKALRKEFRQTIPTGIGVIDQLTGGGLGRGEIGVILSPSGAGKTTALTIIANTAFEGERNVAQIIFEDTKDQIKRKHYTIWAKSALSRLDEEEENKRVFDISTEKAKSLEGKGRLIIKRFSQENTTMVDIKNWMIGFQKKWGFKFDLLVLDYLDCLESHKKSPDRNEAELAIVKAFEALSSDFNIPAWTALQSNRSGFGAEFVEAHQTGGNIKRLQKAHFFMSIAKTPAQQEANFANIRIIKARFAKDGQTFEDCVFNNDTMQIIIDDPRYPFTKNYKSLKHYENADELESTANKIHVAVSQITEHTEHTEEALINKVNEDDINTVNTISDVAHMSPEEINKLLRSNSIEEEKPKPVEVQPEVIPVVNTEISEYLEQLRKEINGEFTVKEKEIVKTITDDKFELDGVIETVNDDKFELDGVIETVNNIIEIESFKWNGESGSTINEITKVIEVMVENKPPPIEIPADNKIYEIQKSTESPPIILQQEKNIVVNNIKNYGEILLIDPDEPLEQDKSVIDMLAKLRKNQNVIKKE